MDQYLPTININPKIRFALYLLSAIALIGIDYAVGKNWAGQEEVSLVNKLAALIALLAAAKTNTSSAPPVVQGIVVSDSTGEVGTISATLGANPYGDDASSDSPSDALSHDDYGYAPDRIEPTYGDAPNPRDYPRTVEDGDPSR